MRSPEDGVMMCLVVCVPRADKLYRLEWMRAGCPSEGPLHSEKNRLRNAVCRKRIR